MVWASPMAWKPSTVGPPVVVDERRSRLSRPVIGRTPPIGSSRAVAEEQVGPGQQPAGLVEAVGVGQRGAQVAVVGADGEGDRQRVAVARDAEELHEPEVAAELGVDRHVDVAGIAVPAGEVHQPALVDPSRARRRRASASQPGTVAAAAGGRRSRRRRRAWCRRRGATPATTGVPPSPVGPATSPVDADAGADSTSGWASDGLAQHPLEGGAAHDDHLQVLVAGLRARRGRAVIGIVDAAGREQVVEHVGEAVAELTWRRARKPWVWCTCGAPRRSAAKASSASAAAGSASRSSSVTVVAGPAERQRGGQAADPAAHDDRMLFRHARTPGADFGNIRCQQEATSGLPDSSTGVRSIDRFGGEMAGCEA